MSGTPAASVVIPAFNCAEQLRRALTSLSRSTFDDFEVIVVNDGSTDGTRDVAAAAGARVLDMPAQRGPAAARNAGVEIARGQYLIFLDADVCVTRRTIERLVRTLDKHPSFAAVFGSYDAAPSAGNLISQYRNLVHHFVHQTSSRHASTFWAGCGAVRRSVFDAVGGFDERYARPCVEDIEFGMRIRQAGFRILLDRDIQVTHLKQWHLWTMLVTDVFARGVPWTRLILREGAMPNDLNLKTSQRVSAVLAACLLAITILFALNHPWVWLLLGGGVVGLLALDAWSVTRRVPNVIRVLGVALATASIYVGILISPRLTGVGLLILVMLAAINGSSYMFFARHRHPLFALVVLPLHVLFLWYSTLAFVLGIAGHVIDAVRGNSSAVATRRRAAFSRLPGAANTASRSDRME